MKTYRDTLRKFGRAATSILCKALNATAQRIRCAGFKAMARKRPTDFTRNRKMSFEMLIRFMLTPRKSSTNSALRRFFMALSLSTTMKQQSFSEARAKVNPEALRDIFMVTAGVMIESGQNTWHGYRVLAVDGSKFQLPSSKALGLYYGTMGADASAPTAQVSILYDVLNDAIVDAYLEPLGCDERTQAEWHLNHFSMNPAADGRNVFLYDRGYPSFELIERHMDDGHHFVMRVRRKFSANIDALDAPDGFVDLTKNGKTLTIRVLKFTLDSGEKEVLITNLTDARMGVNAFKKLYFLRWGIETKYSIIKNKLAAEAFTALTPDGILQDFYAALYLANIAACALADAQPIVDTRRNTGANKNVQRVNINEAIGILKDQIIWGLALDDDDEREDAIASAIMQLAEYTVPVRPGRKNPRKPPRKAKHRHNHKVNC